eukprot:1123219-Ditylum_brightwellii.AAC.1
MERHYQDALHPRDLMLVISNARHDKTSYYIKCGYGNNLHEGHGRSSSYVSSNVSSKVSNETQKTVIELCEKTKTPGSTDVDLVNVKGTQKFTRHQVHYMKKL